MPHVCFNILVNEQMLIKWRDWHKSRKRFYSPISRMGKFHIQAAHEVQIRINEMRTARLLQIEKPFEWEKFCEAYRPKL
jgi:hypothetical protein